MSSLDRLMKKRRRKRYKRLKKLFKARDMASKYTKKPIPVIKLDKYFNIWDIETNFTGDIASRIVDEQRRILGDIIRPPKPIGHRL